MKAAASWIRREGEIGRDGGRWSVSLRARFFLVGSVAGNAPRNACGAAYSTDPPALHGVSDGWRARIGASWIRRVERRRDDGVSRFENLALAEAKEAAERERVGSRVEACRSRKRPWTGFISGTPVFAVSLTGLVGDFSVIGVYWYGSGFCLNGRSFDAPVFGLDFMRRRRYRGGS